jgi:hypothetical protein
MCCPAPAPMCCPAPPVCCSMEPSCAYDEGMVGYGPMIGDCGGCGSCGSCSSCDGGGCESGCCGGDMDGAAMTTPAPAPSESTVMPGPAAE